MGFIGKIIYSTISSKEKVEKQQQIIRDKEWNEIKNYIPNSSSFLDVDSGARYNLYKAETDLKCNCIGIGPEPYLYPYPDYVQFFKIHKSKL